MRMDVLATSPAEIERPAVALTIVPPPDSQNPAAVYLAALAPSGRRTMGQALARHRGLDFSISANLHRHPMEVPAMPVPVVDDEARATKSRTFFLDHEGIQEGDVAATGEP